MAITRSTMIWPSGGKVKFLAMGSMWGFTATN